MKTLFLAPMAGVSSLTLEALDWSKKEGGIHLVERKLLLSLYVNFT
jgi:hypothetical protein